MSIYYSKVHRANTNTRSLEATIPREIVGYLELKEGDTLRWESLELEYEKSELGEKGEGTIRVRATAIIKRGRKMQEELKKTKDQVLYLLERYPAARNNDFYLQLLWLKQFGGIVELPWIDWEKIKANSGKLESVRRVRQKIQN